MQIIKYLSYIIEWICSLKWSYTYTRSLCSSIRKRKQLHSDQAIFIFNKKILFFKLIATTKSLRSFTFPFPTQVSPKSGRKAKVCQSGRSPRTACLIANAQQAKTRRGRQSPRRVGRGERENTCLVVSGSDVAGVETLIKSYLPRSWHTSFRLFRKATRQMTNRLPKGIISGHVLGKRYLATSEPVEKPPRSPWSFWGEMTDDRAACGALLLSCRDNQLAGCVDTSNSSYNW